MRLEVLMPKLGLTMTQGTVMEWRKKIGDPVAKGEVLFTVENDKAVVDVESPAEGVLEEILVPEGGTQDIGKPVAYLSSTTGSQEVNQKKPSRENSKDSSIPYTPASPLAKRLARENRIDLSSIPGTGPEGAVVERDLSRTQRTTHSGEPQPELVSQPTSSNLSTSTLHTLSPFQIRGAERMVQSWTTIPQFTLWMDIGVDSLLSIHKALKEQKTPVSFTILLAKFLALVLEQYPLLNSTWRGQGSVEVFTQVHVGIAMDTPAGLLVPVLKDCRNRPLKVLQEEWQVISSRAREGKLAPSDLAGGTITLTNLGMFGIKRFQAIVNPPQVAILSVGEVIGRTKEGSPSTPFSIIEFGLSADHRVVDGAYAAKFLKSFKDALESPLPHLVNRI
ncbi:MAG: 2-oxo acid dehydrogenase subunit E2 [Spirochaetes bacterium]|nr:2-oxo acid dehydrogenase subunit E2 [Spirochaetota bacterium]